MKLPIPLAEPQALHPLPAPARLDYVALEARLLAASPQLAAQNAQIAAPGGLVGLSILNLQLAVSLPYPASPAARGFASSPARRARR